MAHYRYWQEPRYTNTTGRDDKLRLRLLVRNGLLWTAGARHARGAEAEYDEYGDGVYDVDDNCPLHPNAAPLALENGVDAISCADQPCPLPSQDCYIDNLCHEAQTDTDRRGGFSHAQRDGGGPRRCTHRPHWRERASAGITERRERDSETEANVVV